MIPTSTPPLTGEPPVHAGFSLPLDIVVAPGRAFLKIARTSEWIPGLIVILVLGALTLVLQAPAEIHIVARMKLENPAPPGVIVQGLAIGLLAEPALTALLIATTLTAMARFKDPAAPFARYFSLALNCSIPSSMGALLHAAVATLRQPEAFASLRAFTLALPDTLGAFAAVGNERELAFLGMFNIFDAWSFILLGFGISLFFGMRFSYALPVSAVMYFAILLIFSQ